MPVLASVVLMFIRIELLNFGVERRVGQVFVIRCMAVRETGNLMISSSSRAAG